MDAYFSKKSLSHFKVDENDNRIIICLVTGEELIVDASGHMEWTGTLRRMLKEYETYDGVIRYDTTNKKLYF
jgi:hypothetical protein